MATFVSCMYIVYKITDRNKKCKGTYIVSIYNSLLYSDICRKYADLRSNHLQSYIICNDEELKCSTIHRTVTVVGWV